MTEKQHRSIKYINIYPDTVYEEMKVTTKFETIVFMHSSYHSWCKSLQRGRAKLKSRLSLQTYVFKLYHVL